MAWAVLPQAAVHPEKGMAESTGTMRGGKPLCGAFAEKIE